MDQVLRNDMRFEDLCKEVKEIARNSAVAYRSKAVMAGRVFKATVDGVADTQADKHGKGIDDAKFLYDLHIKTFSSKDPDNHTPAGMKVQTSRLRTVMKVAERTTIAPLVEFDRIVAAYRAAAAVNEGKDVRPEFEAIVSWATKQKASEDPISDEEIKACCAKPEPKTPELIDIYKRIEKELGGIVSGENKKGLKDQSEQAIAAHDAMRTLVATLEVTLADEELRVKMAELGYDQSSLVKAAA